MTSEIKRVGGGMGVVPPTPRFAVKRRGQRKRYRRANDCGNGGGIGGGGGGGSGGGVNGGGGVVEIFLERRVAAFTMTGTTIVFQPSSYSSSFLFSLY